MTHTTTPENLKKILETNELVPGGDGHTKGKNLHVSKMVPGLHSRREFNTMLGDSLNPSNPKSKCFVRLNVPEDWVDPFKGEGDDKRFEGRDNWVLNNKVPRTEKGFNIKGLITAHGETPELPSDTKPTYDADACYKGAGRGDSGEGSDG